MAEIKAACQKEDVYKDTVKKLRLKVYELFREANMSVSTVEIEYFDYASGKFNVYAYLDITNPIFYMNAENLFTGIKLVTSWSKKEVSKSLGRKNYYGCAANITSVGIGSDGNSSVKYIVVRFSGTTNATK